VPRKIKREGDVVVGELAGRFSPIASLRIIHARLDMDLNNKEYELSLARFNPYNIYAVYQRAPVYWTSVRHARDARCRAARLKLRVFLILDLMSRSQPKAEKQTCVRLIRCCCWNEVYVAFNVSLQSSLVGFLFNLESFDTLEEKSRESRWFLPLLVSISKVDPNVQIRDDMRISSRDDRLLEDRDVRGSLRAARTRPEDALQFNSR